jgi:hypothetical protein
MNALMILTIARRERSDEEGKFKCSGSSGKMQVDGGCGCGCGCGDVVLGAGWMKDVHSSRQKSASNLKVPSSRRKSAARVGQIL